MLLKCSIRHCVRRRRFLLVNLTLLFLGSAFAFLHYSPWSSPLPSTPSSTITNSSCPQLILEEIRLNCTGEPAEDYCAQQVNLCNAHLSVYKNLFARTRAAILQRNFAKGKRRGGEQIHEVLNQAEGDEYFHFEKNFLQLPCDQLTSNWNFGDGHLNGVFSSLSAYRTCPNDLTAIDEPTIAINRRDYANLYHTITDLYTVYLLCRFFQHEPKSVRILFLDAHPTTNLDLLWSTLFHSSSRLGEMNSSSSVFFRELIWSPPQWRSEIDIKRNRRTAPSFFSDFRAHVLQEFHADAQVNRTWPCETLNIYFLLRKNYVAHPRNPTGRVARQLANENQVIEYLKKKFAENPAVRFSAGHFEQLSLDEQLQIITRTDVLVGIHGAGLTHALFMQSNRTLVELAPPTWQSQIHFELMAAMNRLNYHRCLLHDGLPSTAQTIYECVQQKVEQMCPPPPHISVKLSLSLRSFDIQRSSRSTD